jgi:hypothetical protein
MYNDVIVSITRKFVFMNKEVAYIKPKTYK